MQLTQLKINRSTALEKLVKSRGVVVQEGSGTPFRKIFWSQNALRQISLATGGMLTLSVPANHVVLVRLTLDQFIFWPKLLPKRGIWHQKSQKNSGGDTLGPPQQEGATPSRTHPQHGYTPWAGAKDPPLLGPTCRSRKPFPTNQNLPLHPWIQNV